MDDDAYDDAHKAIVRQIREAQTRMHTSARRRATLPVDGDALGDDIAAKRVILT